MQSILSQLAAFLFKSLASNYFLSAFGLRRHLATDLKHRVDQTVFHGLGASQEAVAVCIFLNLFNRLPGVLGENKVQSLARMEDFPGMNIDIRGLALKPPMGWWIIMRECGRQ